MRKTASKSPLVSRRDCLPRESLSRLQIEARHREALHSAIMTGVLRAVDLGWDRDIIAGEALAYARRSVPDAIRAIGAPDSVLRQLAEARDREALGPE